MEFLTQTVDWLNGVSGFEFSGHGWIAFIAGIVGVTALNIGLMWLTVRSNRSGHDELSDAAGRMAMPPPLKPRSESDAGETRRV